MENAKPEPELMLLAKFAEQIGANPDTMYRWKTRGVKHPLLPHRVFLTLTRMPAGWGLSRVDYDAFIAALNQKP